VTRGTAQADLRVTQHEIKDLLAANRIDEAIVKIDLLIATYPTEFHFLFQRAKCFHDKDDHVSELRDLESSFDMKADSESLDNAFRNYLAQVSETEGFRIVDSLIPFRGNNSVAYRGRAFLKLRKGDYIGTINDVLKAGELDLPTSNIGMTMVFNSLTHLQVRRDAQYERIIDKVEQITNKLDVKKASMPTGHSLERAKIMNASQQVGITKQELLLLWVTFCDEKGNVEKSKLLLDRLVDVEPKQIAYRKRFAYFTRRRLVRQAAKDEEMINQLNIEAITEPIQDPDSSPSGRAYSFLIRGDLYLASRQFEKAIADYVAAIASKHHEAEARAKLAEAIRRRDVSVTEPH
jgi:tetratricopeptide (TPR) repeat protein